jgi:hypothetical protein
LANSSVSGRKRRASEKASHTVHKRSRTADHTSTVVDLLQSTLLSSPAGHSQQLDARLQEIKRKGRTAKATCSIKTERGLVHLAFPFIDISDAGREVRHAQLERKEEN